MMASHTSDMPANDAPSTPSAATSAPVSKLGPRSPA